MPLYEYLCPVCGHGSTEFKPVDQRDQAPICLRCILPTRRVMAAPPQIWNTGGRGGRA